MTASTAMTTASRMQVGARQVQREQQLNAEINAPRMAERGQGREEAGWEESAALAHLQRLVRNWQEATLLLLCCCCCCSRSQQVDRPLALLAVAPSSRSLSLSLSPSLPQSACKSERRFENHIMLMSCVLVSVCLCVCVCMHRRAHTLGIFPSPLSIPHSITISVHMPLSAFPPLFLSISISV